MKLPQEPYKYGSAFEAIKDLDRQLEMTEAILEAKINAVSDLLHDTIKRIERVSGTQKKPTGKGGKHGSKD